MQEDVEGVISEGWEKGGEGCIDLAKSVIKRIKLNQKLNNKPHVLYEDSLPLKAKIEKIATTIYGAKDVSYTAAAEAELGKLTEWGYGDLPICMAKTQNSISHDKNWLGAPSEFARQA